MKRSIRLGFIVPSSNAVVEPMSTAMLSSIDDPYVEISAHFSRVRVEKIDLSEDTNSQFSTQNMVAAAQLLADVYVDVIAWAGTSSAWLGFENDKAICQAIKSATGIPSTTCITALNELILSNASWSFGMVTPYTKAVNDAIRDNYNSHLLRQPIPSDAIIGLDIVKNSDFALVGEPQLDTMITQLVSSGCQAVIVCCTNVRAAQRSAYWERIHPVVVLDSVAVTIWGMLSAVGVSPALVQGWGSLFDTKVAKSKI